MMDRVMEKFKNTTFKPKSLKGKLLLGIYEIRTKPAIHHPYRAGNLNIYKRKLSIEDMQMITNGSRCNDEGDYLAWDKSSWTVGDFVQEFNVEISELCNTDKSSIFLHSAVTFEEGMQTCKRFDNSLMHMPETVEHSEKGFDYHAKAITVRNENGEIQFNGKCVSYWIAAYDTHSEKGFVHYAKTKFIDNYSSICNIRNCYICS